MQVDGVVYAGINQAARALALDVTEMTTRLNSLKEPNYVFLEPGKKTKHTYTKGIRIDGVGYSSISEAAAALGLSRKTVRKRL